MNKRMQLRAIKGEYTVAIQEYDRAQTHDERTAILLRLDDIERRRRVIEGTLS